MADLQLELYVRERDQEALLDMLREDSTQAETVFPALNNHPKSIYIARLGNRPVGYLAMMNGFRRRTHMAVYVTPDFRRQGIGTALLQLAEKLFIDRKEVELSCGVCSEDDRDTLQIMYRHGYYRGHGALTMQRRGDPLPETELTIRSYEESDYPAWHRVYESAFWPMRAATGQLPLYFFAPSDEERRQFATISKNLFVLSVAEEIVAIGKIEGRHLSTVAVRHDMQRRGYGRAMTSFLTNMIMKRGEPVVELGVVQGNPAVDLYETLGFTVTERLACLKRYYRPDSIPSAPPEGFFGDIFR